MVVKLVILQCVVLICIHVSLPTLRRPSSDREYNLNNMLLRIFGRVLELLMSLLLLIVILLAKPIPNPNSPRFGLGLGLKTTSVTLTDT